MGRRTVTFVSVQGHESVSHLIDELRGFWRTQHPPKYRNSNWMEHERRYIIKKLDKMRVPKVTLGKLDEVGRFSLDITPRISWVIENFGHQNFVRYGDDWYFTTVDQAVMFKLSCAL